MINPKKIANIAALVGGTCQLLYVAAVYLFPRATHLYVESMFPGYDISLLATRGGNIGLHLLGVLMVAVSVWVLTYIIFWLYNK